MSQRENGFPEIAVSDSGTMIDFTLAHLWRPESRMRNKSELRIALGEEAKE
jgi:hypothetical protein